jgi:ABC-2 type transport system permease protein
MNKILKHKYWWIGLLLIVVAINVLGSFIYKRLDLTAEKRYSLSATSKKILQNLKEPVEIEVFLKGQFPAGFKRLANATKEFLEECKSYSNGNLNVVFTNPLQDLDEEQAQLFKDSMQYFFDIPNIDVVALQKNQNETATQTNVLPGALVKSGKRVFGINFLRRAIINTGDEEQMAQLFSNTEASLENKFLDAIVKATNADLKTIGYLVGNGEPLDDDVTVSDAITTIAPKSEMNDAYKFGIIDLKTTKFIPDEVQMLLILKPTKPFTDLDKLKIDQYLMRGGNVFWMIDNMYAEFDSLLQSGPQGFVAYDRGLNIDDLLFKYGVRINQNLLQDLNADLLPLVKGNNVNGMQTQKVKFSFLPILKGTNHPISKNLDGIRGVFPNTIDTIKNEGIKKTILLTSSEHARTIGTPYQVDFSFMQYADDASKFTLKDTAVAVLLEGNFTSFFDNRLTQALTDSLKLMNRPFISKAIKPGKMIVVADGDIAKNMVSPRGEILQMAENNFTGITYANKDFYMNSIEYLTSNGEVLNTRSKDFTLRILDPIKKEEDANKWKVLSTVLPLTILLLVGLLNAFMRKRKYIR